MEGVGIYREGERVMRREGRREGREGEIDRYIYNIEKMREGEREREREREREKGKGRDGWRDIYIEKKRRVWDGGTEVRRDGGTEGRRKEGGREGGGGGGGRGEGGKERERGKTKETQRKDSCILSTLTVDC